jgi:muramidase (phage lysozyme)
MHDNSSEDGSPASISQAPTQIEPSSPRSHSKARGLGALLVLTLALGSLGFQVIPRLSKSFILHRFRPNPQMQIAPLAMVGGDPYVRALMRTISASEANDPSPYNLLYGGSRLQDYARHPDTCLAILAGPNVGQCTTAAGRYQFITTTWDEKARDYHPNPSGWWVWTSYSFEPEYQDQVVYRWLSDRAAWETDIPTLLHQGELPEALRLLSGTWTSLGYGIEDNDITPYLGQIYDQILQEELKLARKNAQSSSQ